MSESVASQSTDQSSESVRRITRTYGRTYEEWSVTGRDHLSERNARDGIKNGELIKGWAA